MMKFRVAVGLRLGAKLCEPHSCSQCGSPVDDKGTQPSPANSTEVELVAIVPLIPSSRKH